MVVVTQNLTKVLFHTQKFSAYRYNSKGTRPDPVRQELILWVTRDGKHWMAKIITKG